MSSAGMVTPTPKAMLSPALPVVWVMLFSRMVARRTPNMREKTRKMVIESTATGMEAVTVRTTLSTRYIDEAPKTMPSSAPTTTGTSVSSGMSWLAGMKGLCSPSAASTAATLSAAAARFSGAICGELAGMDIRGPWAKAGVALVARLQGVRQPPARPPQSKVGVQCVAVFHIKVVARRAARMVEVPLEIEVELPREFDGVVLLASSGLPRKVKLKAPTDAIKLSTAYRADRLLADVVRFALRGTLQDVARVQEAARGFIKGARERRRDGATFLVEVSDRGKIDVTELGQPPEAPSGLSTWPPPEAGGPVSPAADRVEGLERRLSRMEAALAKLLGSEKTATERTLGAEPRGRTAPRRATAIDAFAEGLRAELRGRATQLLGESDRAVLACDKAARLAVEAEQQLGAPAGGEEDRELRRLAAQAAPRPNPPQPLPAHVGPYAAARVATPG